MNQYDPEAEKPYELIPFVGRPLRAEGEGHHKINNRLLTGRIILRLGARTALQIASGRFEIYNDEVIAEHSRISIRRRGVIKKLLVVPGSSLKGVLRSLVEVLAPCCVMTASKGTSQELPGMVRRCSKLKSLCPACRLFGMTGKQKENYLGQISIEDARQENPDDFAPLIVRTPILWTPARRSGSLPSRYLDGGEAKGRKVYYHSKPSRGSDARVALPPGALLRTTLHFQNLTEAEMGLLCTALGHHPDYPFWIKIGAAKPVGLGTVETRIAAVDFLPASGIRERGRLGGTLVRLKGSELRDQVSRWIYATERTNLLGQTALEDLYDVLRGENLDRRDAPGGVY